MSEWLKIKLGEIVRNGQGVLQTGPFGSQLHASDYVDHGIPCIMPANIKGTRIDLSKISFIQESDANRLSKHITKVGDIIFSRRGDVTLKALIRNNEEGYFCGTGCILVRPGKNVDSEFLAYYLSTDDSKNWILSKAVGATMPNINTKILADFPIRLPTKKEQSQIAKILSDLDSKIELNNKINAELEAMAKLIYDYWFVQFEFPNEVGKPYKSSGGKMVWNEELKREVPEGWELGNFGTYCKSSGGYAFKSSWWSDNGLKVVKIKDIQEDYTINISDLSSASISGEKIDNKFIAKPGNILIAMTGATVGKFGIVPITDGPLYVNQRVGFFNLGTEPIDKLPFLVNSLNQKYFREAIFTLASGAAQPNISNEQINNIQLLIPRKTLLENYNKTLKANYNKILLNQFQNQKLSELRDWLLPMLMNGQVKVEKLSDKEELINMAAEEREKYR